MSYAPEDVHQRLLEHKGTLCFNPRQPYSEWRTKVEQTLRQIIGHFPEAVDLDIHIEYECQEEDFKEIRFSYASEKGARVPAHLLIPPQGLPAPVMICLQGHTSGMHISLGQVKYPGDEASIAGDRDYAIQAIKQGYAALVIEQRAFGERRDARPEDIRHVVNRPCHHATLTALLFGRTLLGERVWDVMCGIDALAHFPQLDSSRIGCVGDSTGGTITFFAACLDQRIQVAIPAAYVCSFRASLASIDHCEDHYLPGFLNYFELADLAALIAPRKLIVVAGRYDLGFPLWGTLESYETIKAIYQAADAPDNCRLIIGEGGHQFFADLTWPVLKEVSGW